MTSNQKNELYPWNMQFWDMGQRFAIARNAFGAGGSHFDMFLESWTEAADEMADKIGGGMDAVMPNFSSWASLFKWATYASGALLLVWALAPKKKKKGTQ